MRGSELPEAPSGDEPEPIAGGARRVPFGLDRAAARVKLVDPPDRC